MALEPSPHRPLLLRNARILAMDGRPVFSGAIQIAGERIAYVRQESNSSAPECGHADVIDCGGRLLLPGFIDAHLHVLGAARALADVDCSASAAPSIDAILERLRAAADALPPGAWVRGRGYHETVLAERRHPTSSEIDRAVPDHPARLVHASGHASVLNSAALDMLGIETSTEAPPGAQIDRTPNSGEPSGLLIEMEDWLDERIPPSRGVSMPELVKCLSDRLRAAGVTSVQDLGRRNDRRRAALLAGLVAQGRFQPRLSLASGYAAFEAAESVDAPAIAPGPVKLMLNESGETLFPSPARLTEMVLAVHCAGRQVAIHAIEPRAICAALDAIEAALRQHPRPNHRHRIEHASITPPALASRIASLGVVVVSNPGFLWESGERYLSAVTSTELPWLYDVAGLRGAGVQVAAGSDAPVAPSAPLLGIAAACARRSRGGIRLPGETLAFEQAAELFTSGAAGAAFQEQARGRIAPGSLADLVLLDGDSRNLLSLRVALTILGGRVVWSSNR